MAINIILQNSNIHSLQCVFADMVITLKCWSELGPRQKLLNRDLLPSPSSIIHLFVYSYIHSTSIHWASSMCPCITESPAVVGTDTGVVVEPEYWPMGGRRGSHQHCLGTWRISGKKHFEIGSLDREGDKGIPARRMLRERTQRCERWSVFEALAKSINGKSVHICTCAHPNFWSMFSFILLYLVFRKRQGKRSTWGREGRTKLWPKRAPNCLNSILEGRFSHCKNSFVYLHKVFSVWIPSGIARSLFLVSPGHRQAR